MLGRFYAICNRPRVLGSAAKAQAPAAGRWRRSATERPSESHVMSPDMVFPVLDPLQEPIETALIVLRL